MIRKAIKSPTPEPIQKGQESVWSYPRPPRLERTTHHLQVFLADTLIAETRQGWRVLETSHPPVFYFPPQDVQPSFMVPSHQSSGCEWKGQAKYFDIQVADRRAEQAAWTYPLPTDPFECIKGYFAFYAQRVDQCFVNGELVQPQPGQFYGGWITQQIKGPFKGGPGTFGW